MTRHGANLLTSVGILAGTASLALSLTTERFHTAGILILVSAVFDRYDGKVARRLGRETEFGRFLDSANDFLSFGLAPIVFLWRFVFSSGEATFFILGGIYLAFGLFRLVRFNTRRTAATFMGLPITVAGVAVVAGAFLLENVFFTALTAEHLFYPLLASLAVLMVAPFRWRKV